MQNRNALLSTSSDSSGKHHPEIHTAKHESMWQPQEHTPKCNTPENARNLRFPIICDFGCVRHPLGGEQRQPESATHPQRRFAEQSASCVFGCCAFSGALSSPLDYVQPEQLWFRNLGFVLPHLLYEIYSAIFSKFLKLSFLPWVN